MKRTFVTVVCAMILSALLAPSAAAAPAAQSGRIPRFGQGPVGPYDRVNPDLTTELSVQDRGPGLDTGCTFNTTTPSLDFTVDVGRSLGVTTNGVPANLNQLISNGYLAPKAKLRMLVYDVDDDRGEVDQVYFNNKPTPVGTFEGVNDRWKINTFIVDVRDVLFPDPGSFTSPPDKRANRVQVFIDVTNPGSGAWCTAVDWVTLELNTIAPLVLIHGTGADNLAWTSTWVQPPRIAAADYLDAQGVPFQVARLNDPYATSYTNARDVYNWALSTATNYGTDRVHVVGHSKGGLDARAYLRFIGTQQAVRPLSLHTIGTPHYGSLISTLSVIARKNPSATSPDPNVNRFLNSYRQARTFSPLRFLVDCSAEVPRDPALSQLSWGGMTMFNRAVGESPPRDVFVRSYSGDADLNRDRRIQVNEAQPYITAECTRIRGLNTQFADPEQVATNLYTLLRDFNSVTTEIIRRRGGQTTTVTAQNDPTAVRRPIDNDLLVTNDSATFSSNHRHFVGPTQGRNHPNLKDDQTMAAILTAIKLRFPVTRGN